MADAAKPDRRWRLLAMLGPGILVAATGVGAGDLATAAFTGNKLGLAILWAVWLGAVIKFVLNEGLARWQLATGSTLLEGAFTHFGLIAMLLFLVYFFLWSFFVCSALMSACGVAAHALIPLFDDADRAKIVFGLLQSALGVALVELGGFRLFEKIMSVCIAVMFATVTVTAIMLTPDWGEAMRGLSLFRLPEVKESVAWTIALMGGVGGTVTVLCYGYWIREENRTGNDDLAACRLDLAVGYTMTAFFGFAMVIIGSTIEVEGSGARLIVALGFRLEEALGPVARWAFLIGAWGAVFSSLFGVWQSVPYLFADCCRIFRGAPATAVEKPINVKGWAYRGYLYAIATIPAVALFYSFERVQKVYAIIGAMFMPMLALALLLLLGTRRWAKDRRNSWLTNVALIATLLFFLVFGYFGAEG